MTEIYSKIEPEKLLHFIVRSDDIIVERFDAICEKERLQLAVLNMDAGKTFKPHRHIHNKIETIIPAQEAWVCIKGKVMVIYYDLNDRVVETAILRAGDCSVTLYGGHTYEIMEDDTRVYELKSGPYFGQEKDKYFIH